MNVESDKKWIDRLVSASDFQAAAGLRRLLSDIRTFPALTHDGGQDSSCARFLVNLDLFASDYLDGVDVANAHPRMWHHLMVCKECREEFTSICDVRLDSPGAVIGRELVSRVMR